MQRFLFISSLSLLLLVSPFGCFAIPSAANDQKINCEENYKSWMRDMSSHLENATITSIVLPGTVALSESCLLGPPKLGRQKITIGSVVIVAVS
jgi:hypothetical protein